MHKKELEGWRHPVRWNKTQEINAQRSCDDFCGARGRLFLRNKEVPYWASLSSSSSSSSTRRHHHHHHNSHLRREQLGPCCLLFSYVRCEKLITWWGSWPWDSGRWRWPGAPGWNFASAPARCTPRAGSCKSEFGVRCWLWWPKGWRGLPQQCPPEPVRQWNKTWCPEATC